MERQSDSSHERDTTGSLSAIRVRFGLEELAQLARELHEETIADVQLCLLTYWICESKDNYEEAKIHIRELGVDQPKQLYYLCNKINTKKKGYITDRITNQSLRKLLVETRSMRPRYEPDLAYTDIVQLSRHSSAASNGAQCPKRTASLLSSNTWPKPAPGFWRKGELQERKSSAPVRAVSPWPTKSGSEPLIKIKPTVISLARPPLCASLSGSFLSPSSKRGAPPNTPDRPAPLNFRSLRSDSTATTASMRTVSTPLYSSQLSRSTSSPSPRKVDRTSRHLFSLCAESLENISESTATSDDVFEDGISKYLHHRDSSMAAAVEDDILAIFGRNESTRNQRKFALMTDEVSDMNLSASSGQSACRTMDSFQQDEYDPYRYKDEGEGEHTMNGDVFGVHHYNASASEDERLTSAIATRPDDRASTIQAQYSLPSPRSRPLPITFSSVPDSVISSGLYRYEEEGEVGKTVNKFISKSSAHEEDIPTDDTVVPFNDQASMSYSFPGQQTRPLPSRPESIPSISQRRTAMQTRREARSPNSTAAIHFQRPLPLRSYESDAYLYPTFRAQAQPSPRRSSSVDTSPVRGGDPVTLRRLDENETGRRGPRDRTASIRSISQTSMAPSETSTLMDEDVVPTPQNSIADAYRAVASAFIGQLLQKTRERGAQLPGLVNRSFSIRDFLWRDANEHLIVAIYGRRDVELSQTDKDFVDKIAKEMREGVGSTVGYEWVRKLFSPE